MGITDDEGDAREGSELFGGALSIAAGDKNLRGGIVRVNLADGFASLRVRGGCDRASVDDDEFGVMCAGGRGAAAVKKLTFDSGTVGLCGATTELFDVESGHMRQTAKENLT